MAWTAERHEKAIFTGAECVRLGALVAGLLFMLGMIAKALITGYP